MKKYRVNESEHFNLYSMYDNLKAQEIEMVEQPRGTYTSEQWDAIYDRIEEVESLMEKAPFVGSLVDWETLKRIREIRAERQMIRYATCLAAGATESEAAYAFDL